MAKEGSTIGGLMDVIGTETSMGLQYGVPLEAFVTSSPTRGSSPPAGRGTRTSRWPRAITDYIFRWLGIQFLPGYREANTPKRDEGAGTRVEGQSEEDDSAEPYPTASGLAETELDDESPEDSEQSVAKSVTELIASHGNGNGNGHSPSLPRAGRIANSRSDQFATFQADAPACDNCGAITVRNGNCYLCHNCGNSMGCS